MTQTAKELSDQITKAMEGVTPGPWRTFNGTDIFPDDGDIGATKHIADCSMSGSIGGDEQRANALFFALCNPDNMRVLLSALADAELQSTADSRIAELEQQIANIKASRDCQVTIAAGEEERARKAEAELDQWKMAAIGQQGVTMAAVSELSRVESKLAEAVKVIDLMNEVVSYDPGMGSQRILGVNGSAAKRADKAAKAFLASIKGGEDAKA
jgi:murein L,D-transpeptidase YcbB/YkuD